MKEKLEQLVKEASCDIEMAKGLAKLNDVRVAILGKKGALTALLKGMKDVLPQDRPMIGQMVNEARECIEQKIEAVRINMETAEREKKLSQETIDVTLPATRKKLGHSHPNTIVLNKIERIFIGMGYEVVEGPDIEYDYYNCATRF